MADWSEVAERALLRRQSLPPTFGPDAVRPSYDGLGLVNVPALAVQLLAPELMDNVEFGAVVPAVKPALLDAPEVAAAFQQMLERGPVNHVVLLLMDAMGHDQIKARMAAGDLPGLSQAMQHPDNFYMPLTSVYPSTTTTALTSAATARTPQEHGIMGTNNRMPEVGSLVNLIAFAPVVGGAPYTEQQLSADSLVPVANIYRRLETAGVACQHVNFFGFRDSSISRYTTARSGAKFVGYLTPATAFATLRDQLLSKPADGSLKSLTYCYVGSLDGVAHRYGALSSNYIAELAALDFSLNRELFQGLKGRSDILVCVVADHGQRVTDIEKVAWLHDHPDLTGLFSAPVGGERRVTYLYLKPGTEAAAKQYVDTHFGEHFLTLTKAEALEMGLFGLPAQSVSSQANDRLGDLIMIPKGEWITRQFLTANEEGLGYIGVHGGLSRAEMLIPFLAMRF